MYLGDGGGGRGRVGVAGMMVQVMCLDGRGRSKVAVQMWITAPTCEVQSCVVEGAPWGHHLAL